MSLDFERVAFGVFLAVALPRSLPGMIGFFRIITSAIIALYASLPLGNSAITYFIVVACALLAGAPSSLPVRRVTATDVAGKFGRTFRVIRQNLASDSYIAVITLLTVILVVMAAIASDPTEVILLKVGRLADNDSAIAIFGALNATFVSNFLVRVAVARPLGALDRAGEDIAKLLPTSQLVGQLERFVVFSLVAGGQSDAAAIAIAIKSIVRVPEARRHKVGFVEYFLIGTLASVGVSLLNAVIVRLLLGQAPL